MGEWWVNVHTIYSGNRVACNFWRAKHWWLSNIYFVDNIFVVAACTAGKGRQGRFIRG